MALLKEATIEILVIDFYDNTGWEIHYNGDNYKNVIIEDKRFLNDVKTGYYEFRKGTKLIADVNCPWENKETFKILKVYELLF